jgi:hypothetical protein
MAIKPIFLFSISRAGSTLVQRIIAAHDGIATASEPWLLLPHAYTLRPQGVDAEYVHPLLVTAIEDFAATLPEGGDDYVEELRRFALRLYEKAAGPEDAYFLDKSPPYCLIAEEIVQLFPDGKFVFLWRNPLSVIASLIDTWGPWRPTFMSSDLFIGLPRLTDAYEAHRGEVHVARFEDLSAPDEDAWRSLMAYLELEFEPRTLTDFAKVELPGRMGDPTGRKRYQALSSEPGQKWRKTLASPLRREWCRRYLRFLGRERLALMGYDLDELLADLDSLPRCTDSLGTDIWEAVKDVAKEPVRVRTRTRRIGSPHIIRELLRA